MTRCAACRHPLDDFEKSLLAVMRGSIMGDEYRECYFRCPACGRFTLTVTRDRFCGEEVTVTDGKLLDAADAERRLAVVARCPEPWNKRCRCEAHREYFGDALD